MTMTRQRPQLGLLRLLLIGACTLASACVGELEPYQYASDDPTDNPDDPGQPDGGPVEPSCGDGVVDTGAGETCDPPESCPTDCDDGDSCTLDTLSGAADSCSAVCVSDAITAAQDDDGCCPPGSDMTSDSDCWSHDEPSLGPGTDVGYSPESVCLRRIVGFDDG